MWILLCKILCAHHIDHDLIDTDLLIDSSDHHLFIHRLIVTADEVVVEVFVHIANFLHVRERLKCKNIVHVEGMLRKLQAAVL